MNNEIDLLLGAAATDIDLAERTVEVGGPDLGVLTDPSIDPSQWIIASG